jgi:hypothetical protein
MVRVALRQGRKMADVEGEEHAPLGRCTQQLLDIGGVAGHPHVRRPGHVIAPCHQHRIQCLDRRGISNIYP